MWWRRLTSDMIWSACARVFTMSIADSGWMPRASAMPIIVLHLGENSAVGFAQEHPGSVAKRSTRTTFPSTSLTSVTWVTLLVKVAPSGDRMSPITTMMSVDEKALSETPEVLDRPVQDALRGVPVDGPEHG